MIRSNILFKNGLIVLTTITTLMGCINASDKDKNDTSKMSYSEEELYRPNFHFTPEKNWMNDPNGMFYLNGTYHLYFQYYPDDSVWGPMHWGHAVSEDLIQWREKPIAIYPDSLGHIFSGSAVVDHDNRSGFGKDGVPPVIAIFTYHDMAKEKKGDLDFQSQAIAYSNDEGETWTKYSGNPVLPNSGLKDFRDPKVIWDEDRDRWVMALATYEKTLFYASNNLKEWEYLSSFGDGIGAHDGVWECPDLFPIKVQDSEEVKWVLIQSLNPGHINGGSGTQYFIGDFDGTSFILDKKFAQDLEMDEAIWLDYGRDNYAGVTWSNVPEADGRTLFIGWMSNWEYAQLVPTNSWRSSMTLSRELKLKKKSDKYRLASMPVQELNKYKKTLVDTTNIKFKGEYLIYDGSNILNKSIIEIKLENLNTEKYNFRLSNERGDIVDFGIDNINSNFYIDRSNSGQNGFSEKFSNTISKASFKILQNTVTIEFIIDKTSIEIFYNNGETVMTEIFFPNSPFQTLILSATNDSDVILHNLKISHLEFNN
ncbi:MAG: levanase/fructan beta-fructosidase [Ulvibacter sp.]|jgi:fructan beta-fructosidase|tara:strand:- start:4005 stop:5618 length:1614 start_codon:yes stop_codon:yes gene_type:complete